MAPERCHHCGGCIVTDWEEDGAAWVKVRVCLLCRRKPYQAAQQGRNDPHPAWTSAEPNSHDSGSQQFLDSPGGISGGILA